MQIDRAAIIENDRQFRKAIREVAPIFWGDSREKADKAVAGILPFHHLGVRWNTVGRQNIDWSGPHSKHGQWRSQLNRFFQLPSLAMAYRETQDEKYAVAAQDYITDWLRAHPTREGWEIAAHDNTLNLAIRVLQWVQTLPEFLAAGPFSDKFTGDIIASIGVQLTYLLGHMKVYGNWRIAQADAFVRAGIVLSFHPESERWRSHGVRVLNEAFHRQILPDGAHIEANPGYHDWMRRVFQQYYWMKVAMPDLGLVVTAEAVARMWNYTVAARRPNGQDSALHDGHGARTGKRKGDLLAERNAFLKEAGLPVTTPPTSQFFSHAGQAFLRDSWEEDATHLVFDATPLHSAHWHASRNAIQLHAHGRTLIADPGSFTYEGSDPYQGYGTSTRAHSTLNLNGWDQTWSTQTLSYRGARGYDLVFSLYDGGYWKGAHRGGWFSPGHQEGFYGAHHRTLLWIRGRCVVVLDHMYQTGTADRKPRLESVWQLCEGPVELNPAAATAVTRHEDANVLMLFALKPAVATLAVHEGETDPLRGWLPGDGRYVPAPQVVLAVETHVPWNTDLATVLVPFAGQQPPQVQVTATADPEQAGYGKVRLCWEDESTDEVLWTRRLRDPLGAREGIETDSALVHLQKNARGKVVRGFAMDATRLSPYSSRTRKTPGSIVLSKPGSRSSAHAR